MPFFCRGVTPYVLLTYQDYSVYWRLDAGIAQLVEYKLPKLGAAGSNPVSRSRFFSGVAVSTVSRCRGGG